MPDLHLASALSLAAALSASTSASAVGRTTPCSSGSAIAIEVDALKDRTGRIVAELYPANQSDFLKGKDQLLREGKIFRRTVSAIGQQGPVKVCIRAPAPGAYALIVIHDRDGLDKFNISKDGLGLPVAQSIGTARPLVRQAMVTFGSSPKTLRVTMQYLRGLRGFALPSR